MSAPESPAPCPHTDFSIATELSSSGISACAACICGLRGKRFDYQLGYTLSQIEAEEKALLWWEGNMIDCGPSLPEGPDPEKGRDLGGSAKGLTDASRLDLEAERAAFKAWYAYETSGTEKTIAWEARKQRAQFPTAFDAQRKVLAAVVKSQAILARWIVPDSDLDDVDALTALVGVLDDRELVEAVRALEAKPAGAIAKAEQAAEDCAHQNATMICPDCERRPLEAMKKALEAILAKCEPHILKSHIGAYDREIGRDDIADEVADIARSALSDASRKGAT